jgi:hypothetical protein
MALLLEDKSSSFFVKNTEMEAIHFNVYLG